MNAPIEDRLRDVASRLDEASIRYAEARVPAHAHRQPRRIAAVAAVTLGAVAIIGAGVVTSRRISAKPSRPASATVISSPALAPSDIVTTTSSTSVTTTVAPPSTVSETTTPETPPQTFDPTHTPVSDSNGNHVGWVDNTNRSDIIEIPLPASYTAQNPHNPSAIGAQIVRDDAGVPVGLMTGLGFIKGGLIDGTHIDPAVQQRLIDNAIESITSTQAPTP
jgi:hypothetical protein